MPLPNEHAARQKSPKRYVRIRRENNKFGSGIHAIWGVTSAGKVELQSVHFSKKKFTAAQAKTWLKEHKMKTTVEPASNQTDNNNQNQYQRFTRNIRPVVRHDTMEGRPYLVVPCVPMVEGVHNGSNGPLYYPAEELNKTPQVWNAKPIVVYHPKINGQGVSACDPVIFTKRKIGVMMNTKFEDGKLKTEAWLEESKVKKVDERVLQAIENGQMMELSTGLFTDNEPNEGEWNGEAYIAVARNYRPDHLALLPDEVGACSIDDGAGFLRVNDATAACEDEDFYITSTWADDYFPFLTAAGIDTEKLTGNEMGHEGIRKLVYSKLREKKEDAYIEEVYDDYFIYEHKGSLHKQNYEIDGAKVKFTGVAEDVVRVIEYRSASGTFLGNKQSQLNAKESQMEKDKLIQGVIDNEGTRFGEDDREFLEAQEPETLEKLMPPEKKEEPVANAEEKKGEPAKNDVKGNKEQTTDEYVNNAPPKIQKMLRHGLNSYDADITRLTNTILANSRNTFTEEQLKEKDIDELRAIARLAVTDEQERKARFDGQRDAVDNEDFGALPIPKPVVTAQQK